MVETIDSKSTHKRPYIHNPWRAEVSRKMAKKRRDQVRTLKSEMLNTHTKSEHDELSTAFNLAKGESAYSDGYRDALLGVFESFNSNRKKIHSNFTESEAEDIRARSGLPNIRKINPNYYGLAVAYENEQQRLAFLKNVQKRTRVATLDEARENPSVFASQLDELLEYVRGQIMGFKVALVDIYGNNGLANLPDGRDTHTKKSQKK